MSFSHSRISSFNFYFFQINRLIFIAGCLTPFPGKVGPRFAYTCTYKHRHDGFESFETVERTAKPSPA